MDSEAATIYHIKPGAYYYRFLHFTNEKGDFVGNETFTQPNNSRILLF